MKEKDEQAFLKSIYGANPIKKNNKVKKNPSPSQSKYNLIKKTKSLGENNTNNIKKTTTTSSLFKLEKTTINKKLKKGKIPIDKKIDFHGMSVFDAEALFSQTIINCYRKNLRCLLFVTGKGVLKKNNYNQHEIKLYYGKIRNNFQTWALKDDLQKYILSVEQASIDYGADGAFFIYLRKQKI